MTNDPVSLTPQRLLRLFSEHRLLLIAPAIAGAVLAALSTFVSSRDWRAEQGLLIRSDAAGYTEQRLGKFTDLSEMKTVQETLLELARSQSVVKAVLSETLGREPSRSQVADFRDKLRLSPPGGAEFGKTEVFYLGVKNSNRERAIQLVGALTRELDKRLNRLRTQRAESLVSEVERSVGVARDQLREQVEQLASFERSVGADLIELRHLTSPSGGQSGLNQNSLAIEAERRLLASRTQQNEALLVELNAAKEDPTRLLVMPDSLLASQPALRRLKEGLVDAQLNAARTAGVHTADHPFARAARKAKSAVQAELVNELPAAIAGVQLELRVAKRRETQLNDQLVGLRGRSASLAGKRSRYTELTAGVEGQSRVLEASLKQLADARSHLAGVGSASLLSPIDEVETGAHPLGPSRTTVTAAGGLSGLLLGAALVFVLHAPRVEPAAPVAHQTPSQAPGPVDWTNPPSRPVATGAPMAPAASPSSPAAEPALWALELANQPNRPAPAEESFVTSTESPAAPAGV